MNRASWQVTGRFSFDPGRNCYFPAVKVILAKAWIIRFTSVINMFHLYEITVSQL